MVQPGKLETEKVKPILQNWWKRSEMELYFAEIFFFFSQICGYKWVRTDFLLKKSSFFSDLLGLREWEITECSCLVLKPAFWTGMRYPRLFSETVNERICLTYRERGTDGGTAWMTKDKTQNTEKWELRK